METLEPHFRIMESEPAAWFIIGMLKICSIGVAMGNAAQEVKDIADDITLSNEEDGVAAYLEKWII